MKEERTHLITGLTAWFDVLSMMPAAINVPVLIKVNEIYQQLITGSTLEALRVPAGAMTCP